MLMLSYFDNKSFSTNLRILDNVLDMVVFHGVHLVIYIYHMVIIRRKSRGGSETINIGKCYV